jgi:hypothetical protein
MLQKYYIVLGGTLTIMRDTIILYKAGIISYTAINGGFTNRLYIDSTAVNITNKLAVNQSVDSGVGRGIWWWKTQMEIGLHTLLLVVLIVLLLTAQHVEVYTVEQHITIGQERQTPVLKGFYGRTTGINVS